MSQDIRINKGADFLMNVTVLGYTGPSYTALCQIKKSANDPTPFLSCTITKLDENPGCKFEAALTAAQTATFKTKGVSPMEPEQYVYDAIVINEAGLIVRVIEGYAWVYPNVSSEPPN